MELRERLVADAEARGLRKRAGWIYQPLPGTHSTAFEATLDYRSHLEELFGPWVPHRGDLIEYLTFFDPPEIRELILDRDLISFSNGILSLSRMELYGHEEVAQWQGAERRGARHHIPRPLELDSSPGLATALPDLGLDPRIAEVFWALLGRCLFLVGESRGRALHCGRLEVYSRNREPPLRARKNRNPAQPVVAHLWPIGRARQGGDRGAGLCGSRNSAKTSRTTRKITKHPEESLEGGFEVHGVGEPD